MCVAILYKLKVDTQLKTIPTVGFNVESIILRGFKLNIWDVGGQDKIRPLWRHYFTGTKGLIFVVDSGDATRLDEAAVELNRVMADREMRHVVLLVYANKQDQAGAVGREEVAARLRLGELGVERLWRVQPSCATSGEGLVDGLLWLVDALNEVM